MIWHNAKICCYSLFSSSGWRSLYNPQLTGDRPIGNTKLLPLKMKMTQHWNHSTQLMMNHSIALSDSVQTLNFVSLYLLNKLILSCREIICREIISWSHSGDTHIGVLVLLNIVLTHLPLDKISTISQKFPNAFSWMKGFVFRFRFVLKSPFDNNPALV